MHGLIQRSDCKKMIINKKNIIKLSENLSSVSEVKGRSLWQDARSRFLKNKAGINHESFSYPIVTIPFRF